LLYEFFITPELFGKSNSNRESSTILLQLLRNIEKNGLLANPNKDKWVPYVEEKIEKLKPALRDKFRVRFNKLKDQHRFVRHPKHRESDPATDQDWLDLALDLHEQIQFHAIILSKELIDKSASQCDAFVEFFDSLESEIWLNCKDKLSVTKSPDNYRSVLAPVLRYARSMALIDPHLDPRKPRFYKTIEICSDLLGKRKHEGDRLHGRIDIHLAEGDGRTEKGKKSYEAKEDFFNACEKKLQPLINKYRHCFRVLIWKSHEFHNRYILTNQCGISAPWGLDCRSQSTKKDDWSLLSNERQNELWNEFHPDKNCFDLVGRKKFPKNCARKIHKNEIFIQSSSQV